MKLNQLQRHLTYQEVEDEFYSELSSLSTQQVKGIMDRVVQIGMAQNQAIVNEILTNFRENHQDLNDKQGMIEFVRVLCRHLGESADLKALMGAVLEL